MSASEQSQDAPQELRVSKDRKLLTVRFGDAEAYALEAELLRVCSPSAEVQGHGPGQAITIDSVGHYAIRITFDDMHNSGIFSWPFLRELGRERETRWADYLADLDAKGLSRDPVRPVRRN
jgi:DUF971 family protein